MTSPILTETSDPVLEGLPRDLINGLRLAQHARTNFVRGQRIFDDGRPDPSVYLISEGWAVSRLSIGTGDSQILDILGPGSFVGLPHLRDQESDAYSAQALENLLAYRIDVERLQTVCSKNAGLSRWLAETLSRQASQAYRHLTALGQLPARGRLAFAMLRIVDVAQQTGSSVVGKTIGLPMTQEEIGNMLGLTNVSISKLMSAFRKDGLIDYGRNRITIQDVSALSEICGMRLEANRVVAASTPYLANG